MKMTDAEFSRLVTFVRDGYGINLEKKRELVESRLAFHLTQLGCPSYSQYLSAAEAAPDGPECREMIDRLSTNHTYFFREMDAVRDLHLLGAKTRYLRQLAAFLALHLRDDEAAVAGVARGILEVIVWFAMHRHRDRLFPALDDARALALARRLVLDGAAGAPVVEAD